MASLRCYGRRLPRFDGILLLLLITGGQAWVMPNTKPKPLTTKNTATTSISTPLAKSTSIIASSKTTTTTTNPPAHGTVFSTTAENRRHTNAWRNIVHDNFINNNNNNKRDAEFSGNDVDNAYEIFRGTQLEAPMLQAFFRKRPHIVAQRLVRLAAVATQIQWHQRKLSTETAASNAANTDDTEKNKNDTPDRSTMDASAIALRNAVGSLGPVAIKIGQTLAQRPDLVGPATAQALEALQTQTQAFPNAWAHRVLRQELVNGKIPNLSGNRLNDDNDDDDEHNNFALGMPLAPDVYDEGRDPDNTHRPLFQSLTSDPVACASLGQVYRAVLWDNTTVAVKVQRPDALAQLVQDLHCLRALFRTRQALQLKKTHAVSGGDNQATAEQNHAESGATSATDTSDFVERQQDIGAVMDRLGVEILQELDYLQEAQNSQDFRESLAFLGCVTTPTVRTEYTTARVLVTEWIEEVDMASDPEAPAILSRLALQACTASLTVTGLVHADPHRGNLRLVKTKHDDRQQQQPNSVEQPNNASPYQLVFLDFGLMSRVEPLMMEGFARGIQALLARDWMGLTRTLIDVGFVTTPLLYRSDPQDSWQPAADQNMGLAELARDVQRAMEHLEGGMTRFGALATGLREQISPNWLVYTPPYVLLLIRTFLTLEGLAEQVDPDFNIYQVSMPWALRRSLSPESPAGVQALRQTLLKDDQKSIQWERLVELVDKLDAVQAAGSSPTVEETSPTISTWNMAVGSVLASPKEGRALRRTLHDLDSVDLLYRLSGTAEGRKMLQRVGPMGWQWMAAQKSNARTTTKTATAESDLTPHAKLMQRQARWQGVVTRQLLRTHSRKLAHPQSWRTVAHFLGTFLWLRWKPILSGDNTTGRLLERWVLFRQIVLSKWRRNPLQGGSRRVRLAWSRS